VKKLLLTNASGLYDQVYNKSGNKSQVDTILKNLATNLVKELQNPFLKAAESRGLISQLIKLGLADTAREMYLQTRSQKIEKEIK
jgi:hypothetical protein